MRRPAAALIATVVVATACTSGGGDNSQPPGSTGTGPDVQLVAALVRYDGCDALAENIKREATARVGPYGLEGVGYGYGRFAEIGGAVAEDMASPPSTAGMQQGVAGASSSAAAPTAPEAGVDFSTTNVQEEGVDEPDLDKTDGKTLYVVVGDRLRVIDVSHEAPAMVGELALPGGATHQLLLDGSRVLVLSAGTWGGGVGTGYAGPSVGAAVGEQSDPTPHPTVTTSSSTSTSTSTTPPDSSPTTTTLSPTTIPPTTVPPTTGTTTATTVPPDDSVRPAPLNSTVVTTIDVSAPSAPEVISQTTLEGRLLDARMIDGVARIVASSTPRDLGFVYPSTSGAEAQAQRTNAELVESSSVTDWLPTYTVDVGPGAGEGEKPLVGCASVSHTAEFAGFGTLSVSTVDLRGDGTLDPSMTTSIQADGENVYASSRHLYVATTSLDPDRPATDTAIHEFDLADSGPARYLASGSVRGVLLNQFSMSEHDGVLRVATTDRPAVVPDTAMRSTGSAGVAMPAPTVAPVPATESYVSTLEQAGGELRQVGQVGGLGRGEQIKAVRFIGTTGYVVTFRQTDPLYTVDLRNPAAPAVIGELKIPGFSSYLQPVGEGRLLGIGQDATSTGRVKGLQVALFDVSDPADPRQIQKYTLPGASSDAESEHHALLWWAPEGLAIVPVQDFGDAGPELSAPFMGAVGLDVGDAGIAERGRIEHRAISGTYGYPYESYGTPILRTLVVGDSVLSISGAGLESSALSNLAERAWLPFG